MKLIECYIENFGKLHAQKYSFEEGFNCICQNNGEGKSTLAVFIKVMLFGMSDTKRAPLAENDRRHYLPWQGGTCGGYLIFSNGKKSYRIERTFAAKAAQDTYKLLDLSTGQVSGDYPEELGRVLFGIDADAFERTVFLSERNLATKSNNETISEKLSDLVGTDGDIGTVETALDYLEQQRKLYQKRGGAGKLADIRAQISDAESRLIELGRREAELREVEEKIESLTKETEQLDRKKNMLLTQRETALISKAREDAEKKHKEAREKLESLVVRKDELVRFFRGNPPTFKELEEAALEERRAIEIMETQPASSVNDTEYQRLSTIFKERADDTLISRIKSTADRVKLAETQINDAESTRYNALFGKRTPNSSEIDEILTIHGKITKEKRKTAIAPLIFAVLAVISLVPGFVLYKPFFIISALLSVAAIILYAVSVAREKRTKNEYKNRVRDFILSVTDTLPGEELWGNLLFEMKLMSGHTKKCGASDEDIKILTDFVEKFGKCDVADTLSAVHNVIEQYEKYKALKIERSYLEQRRREEISHSERMLARSRAFVARFDTKSDDPFNEIRKNLAEYTELLASVKSGYEQLGALGVTDNTESTESCEITLEEADKALSECEQTRAQIVRELGALAKRQSECEYELLERDTVTAEITELHDKYSDAEDEYNTIILTSKYLTEARDNITAKYLGKTKESLNKYNELISGIPSEGFELDTSFELTRIDSGAARNLESYSKGTRDLYSFAARLALSDSLYGGECPLLILDDPFTAFDDVKIRMALKLLSHLSKTRQIIYFTCSDSRCV